MNVIPYSKNDYCYFKCNDLCCNKLKIGDGLYSNTDNSLYSQIFMTHPVPFWKKFLLLTWGDNKSLRNTCSLECLNNDPNKRLEIEKVVRDEYDRKRSYIVEENGKIISKCDKELDLNVPTNDNIDEYVKKIIVGK